MSISDLDKQIEEQVIKDSLFGSGLGVYEEVMDEAFGDGIKKPGIGIQAKDLIKPPRYTQIRQPGTEPIPLTGTPVKLSDTEGQAAQAKRVSDYNTQSDIVATERQSAVIGANVETKRRAAGVAADEIGAKNSLNAKGLPIFDAPEDVEFRKNNLLNTSGDTVRTATRSKARPESIEAELKTGTELDLEANAADKFKELKNITDLGLVRANAEDKGKIALEREGLKDFRLQNNRKWFGARFLGNLKANATEKELDTREKNVGVINAKTPAAHQEARLGRAVQGMGLALQDIARSGQKQTQATGKTPVTTAGADEGAGPGPSGDTGVKVKVGPNAGNPTGDVGKSYTDAEAMAAEDDEKPRGMHARGGAPVYYDFRRRSNYAQMVPRAIKPIAGSLIRTLGMLGRTTPR